jgi:hypothetical protein
VGCSPLSERENQGREDRETMCRRTIKVFHERDFFCKILKRGKDKVEMELEEQ